MCLTGARRESINTHMQTDLFPAELAAAQREGCTQHGLADAHPFEPLTTDGLGLTEDDKTESEERYWFWDDTEYAREVCIKRHGPL